MYICLYIYVRAWIYISLDQFSRCHVRLFATSWTAPHPACLSITNSQSLLKLMFIESIYKCMCYGLNCGKTMEIVIDFAFLGSKTTADGDCNHEIKRHLLLRRKAMTNLRSDQSLSRVRLFEIPWIAARASLSITNDKTREHIKKQRQKEKSRDITLPTKVHLVKPVIFPVVMYECDIWTIKKTEHQRIDAFELWCWRRLLRVP